VSASRSTFYPWSLMGEKEPTQRTDKGHEIPVPTPKQVLNEFLEGRQAAA